MQDVRKKEKFLQLRTLICWLCQGHDGGKKRCLQSDFAFLETSAWLFQLSHFVKHWQVSWSWICKNHLHTAVFRKRKKNLWSFISVLHETWNLPCNDGKQIHQKVWWHGCLQFSDSLFGQIDFYASDRQQKKKQAWFLTNKEKLDTSGL